MASEKSQITIFTKDFRVDADIDLIPGARLTDFMNEANKFMVVTNATVSDHSGKELLFTGQFINVSIQNIEIVFPSDRQL